MSFRTVRDPIRARDKVARCVERAMVRIGGTHVAIDRVTLFHMLLASFYIHACCVSDQGFFMIDKK